MKNKNVTEKDEWLEFADVIENLAKYSVPDPIPAMTERLLERVRPAVPQSLGFCAVNKRQSIFFTWLKPVFQQVSVFERYFWLANSIIILTGLCVSLGDSGTLGFSLLAPAVAAGGVAYSFRGQKALELELTCPITPYQIVLGRMLVIFVYNTVMSLIGSIILVGSKSGLVFSTLVIDWLAPMLLLTGVALVTAILFNSLISSVTSMLIWSSVLGIKFNWLGSETWRVGLLTSPSVMSIIGLGLIFIGLLCSRKIMENNAYGQLLDSY
jgi:hypothetical protein